MRAEGAGSSTRTLTPTGARRSSVEKSPPSVRRSPTSSALDKDACANNIRVAVRIKPLASREAQEGFGREGAVEVVGNTVVARNLDRFVYDSEGIFSREKSFGFDVILDSRMKESKDHASQEKVFQELGMPMIENALDAYNGCLLAYGQTGSGKSHSVLGESGSEDERGVLPRACQHLFDTVASRKAEAEAAGCRLEATVLASYLEIYQEKMYDLLVNTRTDLQVRVHPVLGPHVPSLTGCPVENIDEVKDLLDFGAKNRAVAATMMNANSSRSHAVFTVDLRLSLQGPEAKDMQSKVHFVDLAGSERQKRAHTTGERLQEGIAINQSLSSLSRVIMALASGQGRHAVFRESKLTLLLKDALSGNSRTVLLACISPAASNAEESLSTLEFAARCKLIKTNAKKNEQDKRDLINSLSEEKQRIQGQLELELRQRQALQEELDREVRQSQENQQLVSRMREEKLAIESQLRTLEAAGQSRTAEEVERLRQEKEREAERLRKEKEHEVSAVDAERRQALEQLERAREKQEADLLQWARRQEESEKRASLLQEALQQTNEEKAAQLSRADAERRRAVAELQEKLAEVRRKEEAERLRVSEAVKREEELKRLVEQEMRRFESKEEDMRRELAGLQSLSDSVLLQKQDLEQRATEQKSRRECLLRDLGIVGMESLEESAQAPRLVNLHADPMLEGCLVYYLPRGETRIGSSVERCRVCLSGLDVAEEVCAISNADDEIIAVHALPGGLVRVNGAAVTEAPQALANGDRLAVGRAHIFRVVVPKGRGKSQEQTDEEEFGRAMQELQACAEVDPRWRRGVDAAVLAVKRDYSTREANALLDEAKAASEVVAEANAILRMVPAEWAGGVSSYELAVLFRSDGLPTVCVVARQGEGEDGEVGISGGIWEVDRFKCERLEQMREAAESISSKKQQKQTTRSTQVDSDPTRACWARTKDATNREDEQTSALPSQSDWEPHVWAEVSLEDLRSLTEFYREVQQEKEEQETRSSSSTLWDYLFGSGKTGGHHWWSLLTEPLSRSLSQATVSALEKPVAAGASALRTPRLKARSSSATAASGLSSNQARSSSATAASGRAGVGARNAASTTSKDPADGPPSKEQSSPPGAAGEIQPSHPFPGASSPISGEPQPDADSSRAECRRATFGGMPNGSQRAGERWPAAERDNLKADIVVGQSLPTQKVREDASPTAPDHVGRSQSFAGPPGRAQASRTSTPPRRAKRHGEVAEVRIEELFQGRLGVRLRMEGLVVSGFDIPQAKDMGWQVGDEIIAVNGERVVNKDDFRRELAEARKELPIVFLVARLPNSPPSRPAGPGGAPGPGASPGIEERSRTALMPTGPC